MKVRLIINMLTPCNLPRTQITDHQLRFTWTSLLNKQWPTDMQIKGRKILIHSIMLGVFLLADVNMKQKQN